jgi:hypothetical protein
MMRLVALAALCVVALAQFDAQSEIETLRTQMEKRLDVLNAKLSNGWSCSFIVVAVFDVVFVRLLVVFVLVLVGGCWRP